MVSNEGKALHLQRDRIAAQNGYLPSLDGLRAVSVLIVLFSHFVSSKFFPGGLGVYIFFVISGFLITRLLFAEMKENGTISLKGFYVRRIVRLYPVVILFTIAVLLTYAVNGLEIDFMQPLSALFYFSNYLYNYMAMSSNPPDRMPFMIFWSLSVEEHFYLAFPALFLALRGKAAPTLCAMTIIVVACLLGRTAAAYMYPELLKTRTFYYHTEFRIDSIAFGVFLAAVCETVSGRNAIIRIAHPATLIVSALTILACLAYRDAMFRETLRYTVLGFAISLLVVSILFSDRLILVQRILNARPMVLIGRLSYSLYVWHYISPQVTQFLVGQPPKPILVVAKIAVSFALATSSYLLVEQPLIKLRKRLGSNARSAVSVAPQLS
jgi:peptidoglycan/LPS O-acetylase OafA/YrhL